MPPALTIVLADDHQMVRQGLKALLERDDLTSSEKRMTGTKPSG